jgi:UPF0755 protein
MRRKVIRVVFAALIGLIVLFTFIFILHRQPSVMLVPKVTVTIPEGYTVAEINKKLNDVGVLNGQDLPSGIEGYLFPDTYQFFVSSSPDVVLQKFISNFNLKVAPLFSENTNIQQTLIVASLIEREIKPAPTSTPYSKSDRAIVSGIIQKRLANNMPLQIDATLCYIKPEPCLPLTPQDMKVDSPYNTYIHSGLPPTPIDNPGADAIYAALHPVPSSYWFFLSDPKTGVTVFAKTLDQQSQNIVKYLQ